MWREKIKALLGNKWRESRGRWVGSYLTFQLFPLSFAVVSYEISNLEARRERKIQLFSNVCLSAFVCNRPNFWEIPIDKPTCMSLRPLHSTNRKPGGEYKKAEERFSSYKANTSSKIEVKESREDVTKRLRTFNQQAAKMARLTLRGENKLRNVNPAIVSPHNRCSTLACPSSV